MATILIKRSNVAGAVPTAGDLTNSSGGAEIAVNTEDGRLFTKNSAGAVVEIGGMPSALTTNSLTVSGATDLNGILTVSGNSTFSSDVSIVGDLSVTGSGTFASEVDFLSIVNISGTTTITNGLVVGGATDLNGILTVSGNSTFSSDVSIVGDLNVTGSGTFASEVDFGGPINVSGATTVNALTANGDTDLNGTLSVSGIATFSSDVNIAGDLSVTGSGSFAAEVDFLGPVNIAGATDLDGTLTVSGTTTVDTFIAGNSDVNGTLTVSGIATFSSDVSVVGDLNVTGSGTFAAEVDFGGPINVSGATTVNALTANGNADFNGTMTVSGAATFSGDVNVVGDLAVTGSATFSTEVDFLGPVNISGTTTVGTINATTVDTTNIEVTNIKAKDGTAAASIADSTGVFTHSTTTVFPAGAVGTPSITTAGDTNTGIYFPAADTIGFVEGGAEAMRIDSSGRLLVGASANINSYLTQIASTSSDSLSLLRYAASVGGTELSLVKSRSATVGTNTIVQSGDTLGTITFRGADGASYLQAASISSAVDGTPGSGDMPGRLVFSTTADGGSSPTERMRIDSAGNLGLKVTPSASWQSGRAVMQIGVAMAVDCNNTSQAIMSANRVYTGSQDLYINSANATVYQQLNGDHSWFTAPSGTAGNAITFTQALKLDANKNLLLNGTTAPASGVGTFAIFNGTAPTGSVTNGIVLYAEDVSSSSELKVRDEAGNVTTLSPHNFSVIPEGPSEDMAWSYYSERDGKRINVDMLKAIRLLEKLSGEKLVYES